MAYLCKQIRIYRDFWTASSAIEQFFNDGHREIFAGYHSDVDLTTEVSFVLSESIKANPRKLGFFVEMKSPDTWGFYQHSRSDKLQLGTFKLQPDTNYCDLSIMDIEQFAYWTGPLREVARALESYLESKEFLYPPRATPAQNNVVNIGEGAHVGQLAVGHNIEQKNVTHENPGPALVWTHEPVSEWDFRAPRKIPSYVPSDKEKIFIKFSELFLGKRPYDLIQACHDFFDEWVEHKEWNCWFQVKPNSGESFDSYKSSVRLVGRCDECLTREVNGQILEFNGSEIYAEVMIEARAEKLVISASPFHWACLEEAWKIFRQFLLSEGLVQELQDS